MLVHRYQSLCPMQAIPYNWLQLLVYAVFMVKEMYLGYLLPSGCPVELLVEYKLIPPEVNQHIA